MVIVRDHMFLRPFFALNVVEAFYFARNALCVIVSWHDSSDSNLWLYFFFLRTELAVELIDIIVVHVALDARTFVDSCLHAEVNGTSDALTELHEKNGSAIKDTLEERDHHHGQENSQNADFERSLLLFHLVTQIADHDFERAKEI